MLIEVLADVRVVRLGLRRPRTTPDAVLADRTYATGPFRCHPRASGIKAVIPEKEDAAVARRRRGSAGGRPRALDTETDKRRDVVERSFAQFEQNRGPATRNASLVACPLLVSAAVSVAESVFSASTDRLCRFRHSKSRVRLESVVQ